MKHIKTFEQHSNIKSTNEEVFGFSKKEKEEKEADRLRLVSQFEELKDKLKDKTATVEKALAFAEKYKDDYKGNFVLNSGSLGYNEVKSKNPLQGKTGGSSGMGTAIS